MQSRFLATVGVFGIIYVLLFPVFGVGFVVTLLVTDSFGWGLAGGAVADVALIALVIRASLNDD